MTIARKWNATWGVDDGIAVDVTEYPHFDDKNWDFAGSNAIVRNSETGEWIAVVDINERDNFQVRYCEHCLEFGFKYKLGPKLKKHGEGPQPDDDKFVSCWECGRTYELYKTYPENKLKVPTRTTETPFQEDATFLSIGAKDRKKKRKKIGENEDEEIQREIDRHGEQNVRIIQ